MTLYLFKVREGKKYLSNFYFKQDEKMLLKANRQSNRKIYFIKHFFLMFSTLSSQTPKVLNSLHVNR